jgi:hypothetical protein
VVHLHITKKKDVMKKHKLDEPQAKTIIDLVDQALTEGKNKHLYDGGDL